MHTKCITVAQIWPRLKGVFESRAGVIDELDKHRFRTIHICVAGKREEVNEFEQTGSVVYYLTTKPNVRCFNVFAVWRLIHILKREEVRILHCHKHKATVYGVFASFFTRVPVVISHVHGINGTRNWRRRLLNWFLFKKIDQIITDGKAIAQDVLSDNPSLSREKLHWLANSHGLVEPTVQIPDLTTEQRNGIIRTGREKARNNQGGLRTLAAELESVYGRCAIKKGIIYEYYLISYPKSGRTWLRTMIARLFQLHFNVTPKMKDFLKLISYCKYNKAIPSVRVEHYPDKKSSWEKDVAGLREMLNCFRQSKVIFLVRDPRDVVVSHFFQRTRRIKEASPVFAGSMSEYIRDEQFGVKAVIKFCNLWASGRDTPDSFLLVRYEDLRKDTAKELARVAEFLGISGVSTQKLEDSVAFATFDNMRRLESNDFFKSKILRPGRADDPDSYKTRRGKVGGYSDYLSPADVEFLNHTLAGEFDPFFGYSFVVEGEKTEEISNPSDSS